MIEYARPIDDGLDLVISRKTSQDEEWLVLLASQGQAYFKSLSTGDVSGVDADSIRAFMKDALKSGPMATNCAWCSEIVHDRLFYLQLAELVQNPNWPAVAKARNFDLAREWMAISRSRATGLKGVLDARVKDAGVLKSWGKTHAEADEAKAAYAKLVTPIANVVKDHMGTDRARAWIDAAWEAALPVQNTLSEPQSFAQALDRALTTLDGGKPSLAGGSSSSSHYYYGRRERGLGLAADPNDHAIWDGDLEPAKGGRVKIDFAKLCDWTCEEYLRQGYCESPLEFWRTWADCLALEVLVTGDVVEKWPKSLLTLHDTLAQEANWKETRQAEPALERAMDERLCAYDWKDRTGHIAMVHPSTAEDIRDEARAMGSCLASYIDPVIRQTTDICFLRNDGKSWVTVEIDPDSRRLVQALARFNEEPTREAWAALARWAAAKGIDTAPVSARMEDATKGD